MMTVRGKKICALALLLLCVCLLFSSCMDEYLDYIDDAVNATGTAAAAQTKTVKTANTAKTTKTTAKTTAPSNDGTGFDSEADIYSYLGIKKYSGSPYAEVNKNTPFFNSSDMKRKPFEEYGKLDGLGRCTAAFACVDKSLMPTGKRESISSVKPTGWKSVKYDFVEERSLYNRSHLIGYQLTAENANKLNLVTGTRYMNAFGMTSFENLVADYIKETGNKVLYRVTPYFAGKELICRGVLMEAKSVEDNGKGVCFNVFVYNVQPYIDIDYNDGSSKISDAYYKLPGQNKTYTVNKNSRKIHDPGCELAGQIKSDNKENVTCPIDALKAQGYTVCKNCLS